MSGLSYKIYVGDGTTKLFSAPDYIDSSHITVKVAGVLTEDWSWNTSSVVELDTAPGVGESVSVIRTTPTTDRLVDFQTGTLLKEADLDRNADNIFFIMQELVDSLGSLLQLDPSVDKWNGEGKTFYNCGDPVEDADLTTKGYVDDTLADYQAACEAAQDAAETAQGLAEDAQTDAEAQAIAATNAKVSAQTAQGLAEDAQAAAEIAETDAQTAQGLAEDAQGLAETAQANAEIAQGLAETAQGLSEDARDLAELWATEDEDVEVTAGKYSAYHYGQKALDAQTAAEAAQGLAEAAEDAAVDAVADAEAEADAAAASASAAAGSASAASGSASAAAGSASAASDSADAAAASAALAATYAVQKYTSTAAPSGGNNGDLWFQYV